MSLVKLLFLLPMLLAGALFAGLWTHTHTTQPAPEQRKTSAETASLLPDNGSDPINRPLWARSAGIPAGARVIALAADVAGGALYALAGSPQEDAPDLAASLYRSADNGATWAQIGQQVLPAAVPLALTVGAGGVVYVALNVNDGQSDGVYRSLDGGATWSMLYSMPAVDLTLSLAADPHNPKLLYAGEASNGLYRTADGGDTWQHLALRSDTGQVAISQVGIAPWDNRQLVVIATPPEGTAVLMSSADAGQTWKALSPAMPRGGINGVTAFAFSPATSAAHLLYARLGGYLDTTGMLLASSDNGVHWQQLTDSLQASSTLALIAIDPAHPQRIYTACYQDAELAASADGGTRWQDLAAHQSFPNDQNGDIFALLVDPASSALLAGTENGVWLDQGQ